jgi:UDP-N-acetylglucosamine acyltransferase
MIDPRAVIDAEARIGPGVSIGAFSIVEAGVEIERDTWVGPHVVIRRGTCIGVENRIFQFSSIGEAPQHVDYHDEPTRLSIGDRNIIREYCTVNRGTAMGGGVTRIGNDNFLMAYVHVAHDCRIGDHTIFANGASLAGHVSVGDFAILGGFTLIHQFCRAGAHCITGIGSVCLQDIPPFVLAAGNTASPRGINTKGLRRREFSDAAILALKRGYRTLFRSGLDLRSALRELEVPARSCPELFEFTEFFRTTRRGVIR